ncbi:hypothetical protein ES707_15858 [subsurface metagenome]
MSVKKKQRTEKLQEILKLLSENEGKMSYGELYGKIALKYGTTKRTFDSYLEALKLAGKIDYDEVFIAWQENSQIITLLSKEMQKK